MIYLVPLSWSSIIVAICIRISSQHLHVLLSKFLIVFVGDHSASATNHKREAAKEALDDNGKSWSKTRRGSRVVFAEEKLPLFSC